MRRRQQGPFVGPRSSHESDDRRLGDRRERSSGVAHRNPLHEQGRGRIREVDLEDDRATALEQNAALGDYPGLGGGGFSRFRYELSDGGPKIAINATTAAMTYRSNGSGSRCAGGLTGPVDTASSPPVRSPPPTLPAPCATNRFRFFAPVAPVGPLFDPLVTTPVPLLSTIGA